MTPVSDDARDLLERMAAALEARPDEGRSFGIPMLNGTTLTIIHKGLPGGHVEVARGIYDQLMQAGLLRKVVPFDRRNILHELTDEAYAYRSARQPPARVASAGRRVIRIAIAVLGVIVGIVAILTWLGVRPPV